jgi:glutaminase
LSQRQRREAREKETAMHCSVFWHSERQWSIAVNASDLAATLLHAYRVAEGERCYRMDAPGSCEDDGLCVVERDGDPVAYGAVDEPVTLMSAVKPFLLAYVHETAGAPAIVERIGAKPSALPYYSLEQLRADGGRPRTAMLNTGAMVLASLMPGDNALDRCARFTQWMRRFVDAPFVMHEACLADVLTPGGDQTNWSLAEELKAAGGFGGLGAEEVYESYFSLCCLTASVRELALAARAAFLRQPKAPVLHQMAIGGLYEATQAWMERTGCPAKSAVSGLMFAVVPGRGVIAAGSPWLNEAGNPLVPLVACELLCLRLRSLG